jgi:energy-coupling factor transport system ATP-binding protein
VDLSLGRPGTSAPLLVDASLSLGAGECVLLEGATGSGKSTLLRALAGLRGVERRAGRIESDGAVTLLLQHVETQLLCTTVGEEVALGLRQRGLAAPRVEARVREVLSAVGLADCVDREVDTLSAGQKQRVLLAALLATGPRVLLLDEPSSALDATARLALARLLGEHKARGMALLVAEHRSDWLEGLVDRRLVIAGGQLREGFRAARPTGPGRRARSHPAPATAERAAGLRRGERVLVTGPNGSGKSSWLRARVRLAESQGGRRQRPGALALVIQEPRRSLFARTAAEEVEFSLARRGLARAARRARARELLSRFDLLPFAEISPLRLSYGQQHRLAIAAALAPRPSLLLLDEPFAGLDPAGRRALLALLALEQAGTGATLVVSSHDPEPLAGWCDRVVDLTGGPERGEAAHG